MTRKHTTLALIVAGFVGMLAGLTIHVAISAEVARKATTVDDVETMRQRLARLSSIEDKDRFLFEYWKLLAQHRVEIAVKKGDRYMIGGAFLVEGPGTAYKLISRDDTRQVVDKIAHVITKHGSWKALPQEGIWDASHVVISTEHYVFLLDLRREMIRVIKR